MTHTAMRFNRGGLFRLLFLLLALGQLALPGHATAKDDVLWLKTEWPPVFTLHGRGFGDQALDWLIDRLPEYQHHTQNLPLARLLRIMERQEITVCTSGLPRNPAREQQFLVSRDFMYMPALALIVRADSIGDFASVRETDGAIEMRRLLVQESLKGGINDNRSYGPTLDGLLQDMQLVRLSKTSNMVSMLAARRLDWVLLYPFEATELARQETPAPAIAGLPIAEIPGLIGGGITCNRTAGGHRIIAEIEGLIAANPSRPWMAPMLDWLDPETRRWVAR